jgi:hypothetical protein
MSIHFLTWNFLNTLRDKIIESKLKMLKNFKIICVKRCTERSFKK